MIRDSYEGKESIDLASVIAEFPNNDDNPRDIPKKKLSQIFDTCVKTETEEYMKVYLRIRPIPANAETTIIVESENTIVTNAPEASKRALYTKTESRHYMFTRVFDSHSHQSEIFDHSAAPMLRRFMDGENCVIFAYGMTNAGKTHTIQGTAANPGILPRLVSAILDKKVHHAHTELHVSALEIYQENIYDLLGKRREKLNIRDAGGKVEVSKLSYHMISSTQDAFKLMDIAAAKRSKSSTFLNTGSSRSHAVYTLTLSKPSADGKEMHTVAFQLVDLAGAERGARTKATSAQQKEANNINTSLMQLWRCLQAVKRKNNDLNSSLEVIPFRESKLTHLLMPILTRAGLGGVAMIACVNPQGDDYDETLSILGNASIASKIREFADVGRVASQTVPTTAPATNVITLPTTSAKPIRMEDLKEYKDKHSKETDNNSTSSSILGLKRRRHESAVGAKVLNTTAGAKKLSTSATHGAKSNKDPLAASKEIDVPITASISVDKEEEEGSERKRLRREIDYLKETNQTLMQQNMNKENEIREEMSKEMMLRSSGLLSKISDLQKQLSVYETQSINDIMTKSVKKAKQSQLTLENEDMIVQLQEAEDEIERIKVEYEYELNCLRYENQKLKEEITKLKGTTAGGKKRKNSKQKNNQENESDNMVVVDGKKSPKNSNSPNRSPLSPIDNSPKVNSNPNTQRSASPKKFPTFATNNEENLVMKSMPPNKNHPVNPNNSSNNDKNSPQRLRTGNIFFGSPSSSANNHVAAAANENAKPATGTYFTRLRSQLIRL